MTNIIHQLIIEYHEKGMSLVDILERQIEPGHQAHEFIRVYREMYPAESTCIPSATISVPMPVAQVPIMGPSAKGQPMLFACRDGYLDLVECRFVPTKTADADKLSSKNSLASRVHYYDGPSMEAGRLGLNKFLDQIFPDLKIRNYVISLYAEKLDGVRRREEFIIHLGSGCNGKTAFQQLLEATFGDYYQNSVFSILNPIIPDTRIVVFSIANKPNSLGDTAYNSQLIKELASGIKYKPFTSGRECYTDFGGYMSNMEMNEMPQINDTGAKRRIRVISYPSVFVPHGDARLVDPENYPNHFPQDYDIRDKIKQLAPFFLERLFERYQALKRDRFKQLETEIPAGVLLSGN